MLWHEIGTRGIPCSHVGQLHRAWHVPKCRDVRPARADINSPMNFSWQRMMDSMLAQNWVFYRPDLADLTAPAWQLLYDEQAADIVLDDTDEVTIILRLGHSDTARINAAPGSNASK